MKLLVCTCSGISDQSVTPLQPLVDESSTRSMVMNEALGSEGFAGSERGLH